MSQPISALSPNVALRDSNAAPAAAAARDTLDAASTQASDGDISFGDILESVNPLQHIPVVSLVYRAVSGNEIGLAPRLIGATILGGPIGLIVAGVTAMLEEATGASVVQHAMALFDGVGDGEGGETLPDTVATDMAQAESEGGLYAWRPAQPTPDADAGTRVIAATPAAPTPPPAETTADNEKAAAPVPAPAAPFAAAAAEAHRDGSESRRIARAMLETQRAQAKLLLANLKTGDADKAAPADGVRALHANLPPSGAVSGWYADAMQRALDKYQSNHTMQPFASDRAER